MQRLKSSLWAEFTTRLETHNRNGNVFIARFNILLSTAEFCDSHEIDPGSEYINKIWSEFLRLNDANRALNLCYFYIQRGQAGAIESGNDFDIVTIPGAMSPNEIAGAKLPFVEDSGSERLGLAPIVLAAGVAAAALVTGAIMTTSIMETRRTELETAVQQHQIELEAQIAKQPGLIPQYAELKKAQAETESAIDSFLGAGTGKFFKGAAGLAIAIAIGLFAYRHIKKDKK